MRRRFSIAPPLLLAGTLAGILSLQPAIAQTAKPSQDPLLDPATANQVFTAQAVDLLDRPPAIPGAGCLSISVSSPQAPPEPNGAYRVTAILDLELRTTLNPAVVTGDRLLRLQLQTPSGHLYQQLDLPFTTTGDQVARAIPGYPRALPVQFLTAAEGTAFEVTAILPVAGTAIVQSSLYGPWTVTPYLDDELDPCGSSQSFALEALPTAAPTLFTDGFESGDTTAWGLP